MELEVIRQKKNQNKTSLSISAQVSEIEHDLAQHIETIKTNMEEEVSVTKQNQKLNENKLANFTEESVYQNSNLNVQIQDLQKEFKQLKSLTEKTNSNSNLIIARIRSLTQTQTQTQAQIYPSAHRATIILSMLQQVFTHVIQTKSQMQTYPLIHKVTRTPIAKMLDQVLTRMTILVHIPAHVAPTMLNHVLTHVPPTPLRMKTPCICMGIPQDP